LTQADRALATGFACPCPVRVLASETPRAIHKRNSIVGELRDLRGPRRASAEKVD